MRYLILAILIIVLLGVGILFKINYNSDSQADLSFQQMDNSKLDSQSETVIEGINDTDNQKIEETEQIEVLPAELLYEVPFTPQAPFGNWDDIRQDTGCEEASILMAMRWVNNQELALKEAEQEIIAMAEFEKENYGHHHDTSSQDTLKLIKDYYNYNNAYVEYDIDVEDIKTALAEGNLVIVPINGQKIGNPYYTLPGPFQHKILIRGYDDEAQEFITNDPGTKRGDGYRYNYQILESALMDYPTGFNEPVDETISSMIVIRK